MLEISQFRQAAKVFNEDVSNHDARQALRVACANKRIIKRRSDGLIDVEASARLLEFALQTQLPGHADALTAEELFAQLLPQVEADPIDGQPLFEGKTTQHPITDWSRVNLERRQVVAYAMERGETIPPAEQTAEVLSAEEFPATRPWSRLMEELKALHAKQRKTAEEEALLLRVRRRLYFDRESQNATTVQVTSGSVPLRQTLVRVLRTSSDFDAFCIDHFPTVYARFATGMDRDARTNLLLQIVSKAAILEALRRQ